MVSNLEFALESNVNTVKNVDPLNALSSILTTVFGMLLTATNPELANAPLPIDASLLPYSKNT